ncbi:hypothetical protein ARMGADRAFT_1085664 [Armillaria gallica]|uniref:Uncharacterized protein n=1 Tax=Armillaria gallica TaxID=47427 RepID=A0A2H3D8U2_ARMGA|nr:hypothetical protein ARMGADRAFT_1085664 [Armillaria gallica]
MSRAGTRQRPSGTSLAQSQPRATQRTQRNRAEETEDEEEDGDATMDVDEEENDPRDDNLVRKSNQLYLARIRALSIRSFNLHKLRSRKPSPMYIGNSVLISTWDLVLDRPTVAAAFYLAFPWQLSSKIHHFPGILTPFLSPASFHPIFLDDEPPPDDDGNDNSLQQYAAMPTKYLEDTQQYPLGFGNIQYTMDDLNFTPDLLST